MAATVLQEALRIKKGGDPVATGLQVYGDDFDTPDGTCIRDYIHVNDLGRAHMLAAERLIERRTNGAEAYNLGIGRGFSILEIINVCQKITAVPIEYQIVTRRPGDPSRLVGNAQKATEVLGWSPKYLEIDRIIETAWHYMNRH